MEYLKAKHLMEILEQVPEDTTIVYARIEDVYFKEHGWKPLKLKADNWWDRLGIENTRLEFVDPEDSSEDDIEDWIPAYEAWYNEEEKVVKITAHY